MFGVIVTTICRPRLPINQKFTLKGAVFDLIKTRIDHLRLFFYCIVVEVACSGVVNMKGMGGFGYQISFCVVHMGTEYWKLM